MKHLYTYHALALTILYSTTAHAESPLTESIQTPVQYTQAGNTAPIANRSLVTVEVAAGELIDKITILEKKSEVLSGEKKKNVDLELQVLNATRDACLTPSPELDQLTKKLSGINRKLWDIEDDIRECERDKNFGEKFIQLARDVYYTNDARCELKRAINNLCGSRLIEEKSYTDYNRHNSTKSGGSSVSQEETLAHLTQGYEALNKKDKEKAHEQFREVIKRDGRNPHALAALAIMHQQAKEYDKAIDYYQSYFKHHQLNPKLALNCYTACIMSGRFDEAEQLAHKVYELQPDEPNKVRMLAMHCRNRRWDEAEKYITMSRYWKDDYDISGKRVIVKTPFEVGNIGFGDIFQFVRYAKHLKDAGAHVTLLTNKERLKPLLSQCPYIDDIIMDKDPLPEHDHLFPLSIFALMLCIKDDAKLAGDVPYMYPDKQLEQAWKEKLAHDTNYKVGLFWTRGQMRDYFSGNTTPCPRSMTLDQLKMLAEIPNVTFYSLDQTMIPEQAIPEGIKFVQYGKALDAEHGSFMDTAAIMKQMDLVITIDSAIAHLAGALGVQTWTMLPTSSCYRWLRDRDDSPYYPTMKLFRQTKFGDWSDVITQVKDALISRVAHKK